MRSLEILNDGKPVYAASSGAPVEVRFEAFDLEAKLHEFIFILAFGYLCPEIS
ncbi:MAG TPA: hypothetical protein VJL87_00945 [Bdellovibrionota bacterium]|nr:hypothetical protein [Bdellovibrionota bacterium]